MEILDFLTDVLLIVLGTVLGYLATRYQKRKRIIVTCDYTEIEFHYDLPEQGPTLGMRLEGIVLFRVVNEGERVVKLVENMGFISRNKDAINLYRYTASGAALPQELEDQDRATIAFEFDKLVDELQQRGIREVTKAYVRDTAGKLHKGPLSKDLKKRFAVSLQSDEGP